jgi:hypothetical protein
MSQLTEPPGQRETVARCWHAQWAIGTSNAQIAQWVGHILAQMNECASATRWNAVSIHINTAESSREYQMLMASTPRWDNMEKLLRREHGLRDRNTSILGPTSHIRSPRMAFSWTAIRCLNPSQHLGTVLRPTGHPSRRALRSRKEIVQRVSTRVPPVRRSRASKELNARMVRTDAASRSSYAAS